MRIDRLLLSGLLVWGQLVHAEPQAVSLDGLDPRVEQLSRRYRDRVSCARARVGRSVLYGFGVGVLGAAAGAGITRFVDRWNSSNGARVGGVFGFSAGFGIGMAASSAGAPDCDLMQFSGRDSAEIDRYLSRRRCLSAGRRAVWGWGIGGVIVGTVASALIARSAFKDEPDLEKFWKGMLVLVVGQGAGGGLGAWIGSRRVAPCDDDAAGSAEQGPQHLPERDSGR